MMLDDKIFVIAGNHREFMDYVNNKIQQRWSRGDFDATTRDYIYVSCAESLRGFRNPHGVFIGSYEKRADIGVILMTLMSRYDMERIPDSVRKLYGRLENIENSTVMNYDYRPVDINNQIKNSNMNTPSNHAVL